MRKTLLSCKRTYWRVIGPGAPMLFAGYGPKRALTSTEMKNSPYLDKPLVPVAVALRSMLAETEAKLATAAPTEKARVQERAEVLREWITPRQSPISS